MIFSGSQNIPFMDTKNNELNRICYFVTNEPVSNMPDSKALFFL